MTHRTRQEIRKAGYEPICIPGPGDAMDADHLGHDHVAGLEAVSLCLRQSEPWDVAATMLCQKPQGHDGNHAYTAEWNDAGLFFGEDEDEPE